MPQTRHHCGKILTKGVNPMGTLTAAISQVGKGASKAKDLTDAEAAEAMRCILSGQADPFELGAFLVAMRIKEESVAELTAFVRVAGDYLEPVPGPAAALTVPAYAGKRQTFPALLAAACVLAACGVPVGIHGHARPVDRMSLADAVAALGGNPDASPEAAARDLERAGVAYLGVERFCPVMHRMLELRQRMGLRSCFHTMGRLVNPFRAPALMVGLSHERTFDKFAQAGHALGYTRILSFRGLEGEAEANPLVDSEGTMLHSDGSAGSFPLLPKALGLAGGSRTTIHVDSPAAGAAMVRAVLIGEGPEVAVAVTLLTAACGLVAAGRAADLFQALPRCRAALEDGTAAERLKTWVGQ
ncbi:MAG: hypothetical protein OEW11_10715 [Nitrospirota bacterium]|nr:hypothetical protein [Nitrospirota bacterium]